MKPLENLSGDRSLSRGFVTAMAMQPPQSLSNPDREEKNILMFVRYQEDKYFCPVTKIHRHMFFERERVF